MQGNNIKNILVTGGNAGIGYALCRQLVADKGCKVYMGSRNAERGQKAVDEIKIKHPEVADKIELLLLDVSNENSVKEASAQLKSKNVTLYALVNNAGIGGNTGSTDDELIQTNFNGPKRVTDAFIEMIDPENGRIVNISSGSASMWMKDKSADVKKFFTSEDTTWEQLSAEVEKRKNDKKESPFSGSYGLSKAGLNLLTIQQAKAYPNLKVTSLSPGYINTNITAGYGAKLTPDQGTVSCMRCLFGDVVSGYYYGSDGLRSPLTVTRDPGMPEYQGEDESTINRLTYNMC
jgi:carbonyl reductase 1